MYNSLRVVMVDKTFTELNRFTFQYSTYNYILYTVTSLRYLSLTCSTDSIISSN